VNRKTLEGAGLLGLYRNRWKYTAGRLDKIRRHRLLTAASGNLNRPVSGVPPQLGHWALDPRRALDPPDSWAHPAFGRDQRITESVNFVVNLRRV
jgi:hypothetical protein